MHSYRKSLTDRAVARVAVIATALLVASGGVVVARSASAGASEFGTTVAGGNGTGSTSSQLNTPTGVAVDAAGYVYVADTVNDRVQRWRPGATAGSTVAGGFGTGAAANQLDTPWDVEVDAAGNVYVSDSYNDRVQRWAPGASVGVTVAGGNGTGGGAAQLNTPQGIFVDAVGNVYVADTGNFRVQRWAPGATSGVTVAGGNGNGTAANQFALPSFVALDADGNLYVSDTINDRVMKWAPGATTGTVAVGGSLGGELQLDSPNGVRVDGSGNIFVTDSGRNRVRRWSPGNPYGTTVAGDGCDNQQCRLALPADIALDGVGNLFVADTLNDRVQARAVGEPASNDLYSPLVPKRLLDSRAGIGGYSSPWGQFATRDVVVTGGSTTVPLNASAVVLNVTVTNPSGGSYLTVWPAGERQPVASNLNFVAGDTVPNLVVVKVGTAGRVSIYNNYGSVDVIADVVGYFSTDGESAYTPLVPKRILDSRNGTGGFTSAWGQAVTRNVSVAGGSTTVPDGASAVVLNVTVTGASIGSYLTAWPAGEVRPVASNLNFVTGDTVPNLVVVKVGAGGQVSLYNNSGSVDVIADVVGYYSPTGESLFTPMVPRRLLDTRGEYAPPPLGALGQGATRDLAVTGGMTLVPDNASAVVLNVTATGPSAGSFLTVWPTGAPRPLASNLNFIAGDSVPNLVVVKVGAGGQISIYNNTGSVHVLADVVGYYTPVT